MDIGMKVEGLAATLAAMAGRAKQVKFATAVALTRTAVRVMDAQQARTPIELDRPKPATVRAMRYTRATKESLIATVRFKRRGEGVPAEEFMRHNILGGRRELKKSEVMLKSIGVLPAGMMTVPGKGATLDAYGNMSRGLIVSILSFFKTFGVAENKYGQLLNTPRMNRAKKSRSKRDYFVVKAGNRLPVGIWERRRTEIKPVLMFVRPGQYRALVKFYETGAATVRKEFDTQFDQALANALKTAR